MTREDRPAAIARDLEAIWSEVVGRPPTSADADFFLSGGTSLAAMKLMARVRKQFGSQLRVREIYDHPTIDALAARLTLLEDDAAGTANGGQ